LFTTKRRPVMPRLMTACANTAIGANAAIDAAERASFFGDIVSRNEWLMPEVMPQWYEGMGLNASEPGWGCG
jgi:hypothetical protein